jgi:hypothetical protein
MIQPQMSKITRTCAWDRAGFGLSDGTKAAVSVALTTADLEAALATGKIAGPYVMVSHSLGSYREPAVHRSASGQGRGHGARRSEHPDQWARLQPANKLRTPARTP